MKHFLILITLLLTSCGMSTNEINESDLKSIVNEVVPEGERDFLELTESKDDDYISISLDAGNDKVIAIGDRINEISEEAYMNGYNWEALFSYYFENNHPEYTELDTDTEAETYLITFDYSDENLKKATEILAIMKEFMSDKKSIYELVEENGGEIEWD